MRIVTLVILLGLSGAVFAAEPKPTDEIAMLSGLWKPVSILYNGQEQLSASRSGMDFTLSIKDGEYRLYRVKDRLKDEHLRLATAKLQLRTSTKTFEMTIQGGPRSGQRLHGIYQLKEGRLHICYGTIDRPLPTELAAPRDSQLFYEIWTPEK